MNRKGFTLIELLAVIIVLALMAIIVIPDILDTLNQSKIQNYNFFITQVQNASQDYAKDHNVLQNVTTSNAVTISLKDLINDNYFKTPLKDPRTNDTLDINNSTIAITLNSTGDIIYTVKLVSQ